MTRLQYFIFSFNLQKNLLLRDNEVFWLETGYSKSVEFSGSGLAKKRLMKTTLLVRIGCITTFHQYNSKNCNFCRLMFGRKNSQNSWFLYRKDSDSCLAMPSLNIVSGRWSILEYFSFLFTSTDNYIPFGISNRNTILGFGI